MGSHFVPGQDAEKIADTLNKVSRESAMQSVGGFYVAKLTPSCEIQALR
jgi:hypothetical protein